MRINEECCHPEPLPPEEIDQIWDSALKYVERSKNTSFREIIKSQKEEENREKKEEEDIVRQATNAILEKHNFITIEETRDILYFHNGVYVPGGDVVIEREAEEQYGYEVSNSKIAEIKGHIRRRTFRKRKEIDADTNIINLRNGLYDIDKNELMPTPPKLHLHKPKANSIQPQSQAKVILAISKANTLSLGD